MKPNKTHRDGPTQLMEQRLYHCPKWLPRIGTRKERVGYSPTYVDQTTTMTSEIKLIFKIEEKNFLTKQTS